MQHGGGRRPRRGPGVTAPIHSYPRPPHASASLRRLQNAHVIHELSVRHHAPPQQRSSLRQHVLIDSPASSYILQRGPPICGWVGVMWTPCIICWVEIQLSRWGHTATRGHDVRTLLHISVYRGIWEHACVWSRDKLLESVRITNEQEYN